MTNNIKNVRPTNKSVFKQGYYSPKYFKKYRGDYTNIIYRSSWEHRFMVYCDLSGHVLEWSSEPISIDYISPLDNRKHKYFIDFYMKIKVDDQNIKEYLIEVKPKKQYMVKPVLEGKKTPKKIERYKNEMQTWLIKNAKFAAAIEYAQTVNMEFKIINESHLNGIKL